MCGFACSRLATTNLRQLCVLRMQYYSILEKHLPFGGAFEVSNSQHFRPKLNLDFDLGHLRGESAMPQIKVRCHDRWWLAVSLHSSKKNEK